MEIFDHWHDWSAARDRAAASLDARTLTLLDEAVEVARRCHGDQTRPAGEPYLEHLLEVLEILVEGVGVTDEALLVAALLHDVVEDTDCPEEEICARFGPRVADFVAWVTFQGVKSGGDKAAARRDYFVRLLDAPDDVVTLKLADRLSNVQRLDTHPRPEKQRSYYRETCEFILPLAARIAWFQQAYAAWRERYRYLEDVQRPTRGPERKN